jgi:hypothetical protein
MTRSGDEPHDDDDLGLDESLSSMRSMWRDLADEEPSDRGMAALMAAAREKADSMRPQQSWWARLVDVLRRPPVLAVATVVVLIGGAVVISQRKDDLKTESETTTSSAAGPAANPTANATAPTPGPVDVGDVAGDNTEGGRVGAPGAGSAASVAEPPPPVVTPERTPVRPQHSQPKPDSKPSTVTSTEEAKQVPKVEKAPEKKASEKPPSKDDANKQSKGAMQLATGDDEIQPSSGTSSDAPAAPPEAPGDHTSVLRKPLPSIEGEDRTARDASVAQLIKQCEAAAAKNDCAVVRTIAAKIAQQDPQTYRNRVVKNAKVARCLEPSPPVEAAPVTNE